MLNLIDIYIYIYKMYDIYYLLLLMKSLITLILMQL